MDEAERRPGGLSPIKVFLALAALLSILGFVAFQVFEAPKVDPLPGRPATSAPTDAEAIGEFHRLRGIVDEAYALANRDLIASAFIDGSPSARRVTRGISRLAKADARFIREFRTLDLRVLESSAVEVVMEERLISDGRLVDESGAEIGKHRTPEEQVIVWVLRTEMGEWQIYDSTITSAEPVRR